MTTALVYYHWGSLQESHRCPEHQYLEKYIAFFVSNNSYTSSYDSCEWEEPKEYIFIPLLEDEVSQVYRKCNLISTTLSKQPLGIIGFMNINRFSFSRSDTLIPEICNV